MTRATDREADHPRAVFADRREAGRRLAGLLEHYRAAPNVQVVALGRGGIPVGWEIAAALGAPLDVVVVGRLAVPAQPELVVGALACGGRVVLNDDVVRALKVTPSQVRQVAEQRRQELAGQDAWYRVGRPALDVTGATVIVADDGLSTGSCMLAAVQALREQQPSAIVVAVPAAPASTRLTFGGLVEDFVCACLSSPFHAVGPEFWGSAEVTDAEARELLDTATTGPSVARSVVGRTPAEAVRRAAIEAPGGVPSRADLADLIGDARVVLIGASTHGSREFATARVEISKRLVADHGFVGVAVEADWPDAYRVNQFVCHRGADTTAEAALREFDRFPNWTWRNTVMWDFASWLCGRNHSRGLDGVPNVGFYGLDLYGMHRAMHEVVDYLDRVDPAAAARARARYASFDHVAGGPDGRAYGVAAAFGAGEKCEHQIVDQLEELRHNVSWYRAQKEVTTVDELFEIERDAWTVRAAEQYYRALFADNTSAWNVRETHMADTLDALLQHLGRRQAAPARIVVWAHNSHVGDARATELSADGRLTLGQLARQRYGTRCRLIGLSTYTGTVTAASRWGARAEQKAVRPALAGSVEELFHDTGLESLLIRSDTPDRAARAALETARLARAIGVVYLPNAERQSHYVLARPADQYDAMIHIDTTHALVPLDSARTDDHHDTPSTFPSGV